jgi:Protein of unknown function (DUF3606)
MADGKRVGDPTDRMRININDGNDVRYWTPKLGCTLPQLQHAVKQVGVMADKVEGYLKRR